MARVIRIKNNAGDILYTFDVPDPPAPGYPPNAYNQYWNLARVHCELNNRTSPSTPQWADDDTGVLIYSKVCPECSSVLP